MVGRTARIRRLPLAFAAATLLVAGCATGGQARQNRAAAALEQEIRARGLEPHEIVKPLQLTESMRAFARDAIGATRTDAGRLKALLDRLLDPAYLDLSYAWGYTGTAQEVFEQRQANCLAFTNLFVGMAREVGIPVYFLVVRDGESFRKEGDLVVISDHVAVGYGPAHQRRVIDFSTERDAELRFATQVTDLTALALFYSNRGAESLQAADVADALDWLGRSVALDPELATAWVNYGVALRRSGDQDGAESAYRRALELDPEIRSASANLAGLLRLSGRGEEAREIELVLAQGGGRNPYTYLSLGDVSVRHGRYDEADRLYRRAISLAQDDAEPYAALGALAVTTGDLRTARRLLRKAKRRDAEHPRTTRLVRMIAGQRG